MYVLLPPSETKEPGGDGPALDLDALGFPALNPLRAQLIERLTGLCADPAAARAALGVAASKDAEIAATAALRTAPTRAATLHRGAFRPSGYGRAAAGRPRPRR